ncbi:ICOS ligand-like [Scyliorhinus canicula]|uniref:ICOS ligand-like n=1 Tax=Scyliorhinus canicula TaxID=7830 RepID=UPI0018F43EC5|nr:ICOS ligand-like [Scyliorhinus canicula]XP_038670863.1 ICOS ligand-like [Scyliorhinus canicula]
MELFLLGLWLSVFAAVTGSIDSSCPRGSYINDVAHHGGDAVLRCSSDGGLIERVYWQREQVEGGDPEMVKAYCAMRSDCNLSGPNYTGRTDFIDNSTQGNFNLRLHQVNLKDEGCYHCVIQVKRKDVPSIKHCYIQLYVVAQYSKPLIKLNQLGDVAPGQMELNCSSSGGYPEAGVRWVNKSDNSTFPEELVQTESSTNKLGLYIVTSVLRLHVADGTIACHIVNNRTKNVTESEIVLSERSGLKDYSIHSGAANQTMLSYILCFLFASLPLFLD